MPNTLRSGKSVAYSFLQFTVLQCLNIFFRHKVVVNKEALEHKGPLIICANHQNAFLDALLLVCATNHQPYAFTRADVFKKPLLRKVLTFLRMIPIYRIRDGYQSLHQNQLLFDECVTLFHDKGRLIIFPEGNHGDAKKLRKLKSGTARLVVKALENKVKDLAILPVGIEYSNKHRFRSNVLINIGPPIYADEYIGDKLSEPVDLVQKFNEKLTASLRSLVVHIEEEENERLQSWKEKWPVEHVNSVVFVENMKKRIEFQGDALLQSNNSSSVYSTSQEYPLRWFFYLPDVLLKKLTLKVKDDQFIGSFKVLGILILYPLYFFLSAGILAWLSVEIAIFYMVLFLLIAMGWVWFLDQKKSSE